MALNFHETAPALTIEDVHALFRSPMVRVMLNWDTLLRTRARVSLRVMRDVTALYAPWYVDPELGHEVSYEEANRQPLRLSAVGDHLHMLNPGRREAIDTIAATHTSTALWTVPCYSVGGDDLLVLDGNHRLSAAHVHRLPVRILAVVIHGPLDATVLPDLVHWSTRSTIVAAASIAPVKEIAP